MVWSRETWKEKRRVGRKRFVTRQTLVGIAFMVPALLAIQFLPPALFWGEGWPSLGMFIRATLIVLAIIAVGWWASSRYLWWDMERRYPDLE